MEQQHAYDVLVVGGGASGMMAALVAAEAGKCVLILEKNKHLGEKLKITGGGRCNITNAQFNVREFLKIYGKAEPFLHSPFSQFSAQDTFTFFESRGLPLVTQARNRVFPKTEKASDVFNILKRGLDAKKVTIKTNTTVKKITHKDGAITEVVTDNGSYRANAYIIATGGQSHPETGSTGDGFRWLAQLGHTVKKPTPTIVPLAVDEDWVTSLAGISLSFMKISFFLNGKRKISKKGKVLFTHFGLSGPLILNSATEVADLLQEGPVYTEIDAYPDTDHGSLEKQILAVFDANKNKMLKNIFKEITPEGTSHAIQSLLPEVNFETKVHSVSKEDRKRIVHLLKALPLTVSGLMGFDRAVVADGGVSLEEIDTRTMRSKVLSNMYVTGDLLHINRPSGGYSLQLCWTTGYVAGIAA